MSSKSKVKQATPVKKTRAELKKEEALRKK